MNKAVLAMILCVVSASSFAARTWPIVGVRKVNFSIADYDPSRQQVSFLATDGKTYYYKHEGDAMRLRYAEAYLSILLTAQTTGKNVELTSDDGYDANSRIIVAITIAE